MTFYVHRSNRTERLVDALAEVVAEPQANVLAPEWIVVSSPGMERWLSMQLAKRVGVWANPSFPFPRRGNSEVVAAQQSEVTQMRQSELGCYVNWITRWKSRRPDLTPVRASYARRGRK